MKYTILNADKVLCGKDLIPQDHMSVIIEGGTIKEIVPQNECPFIEDAERITLKDTTVMPGMIECHNHLSIDATIPEHLELLAWSTECELTLIALDGLKKDLMSGVTTARCMGDRFYIDVTLFSCCLKKLLISNILCFFFPFSGKKSNSFRSKIFCFINRFKKCCFCF